jgi:hypothetical protein
MLYKQHTSNHGVNIPPPFFCGQGVKHVPDGANCRDSKGGKYAKGKPPREKHNLLQSIKKKRENFCRDKFQKR